MKSLINFGLINIDKPAGPTSFAVSEFVRKKLNLKKTSHMGTLDPKVTGVLPITLGRACKLSSYFIKHDKSYVGILHTHKPQNLKDIQELINKNFFGKIKQTPPHKSSVKREERIREVYEFRFIEASENNKDFLFKCKVQGGTYIRKICSDLGEMIGGAHMAELRRTVAGIFNENSLIDLYEFERAVDSEEIEKYIIPAEDAIKKVLPFVKVDKRALKSLLNGKPLFLEDVSVGIPKKERFAVFCLEGFVGVYRKTNEKKNIARPEFVYN